MYKTERMRPAVVIPAFNAARTIAEVVRGVQEALAERARWDADLAPVPIIVVDDGSIDDTAEIARALGVTVCAHSENQGKGWALQTGLRAAQEAGCDAVLTIDADGQHPAADAMRVLDGHPDARVLLLGARDLVLAGAPRGNIIGNRASNFFVSVFTLRRFRDTQCGLRRYPVSETLAIRTKDRRFGYEAEIILASFDWASRSSKCPCMWSIRRAVRPERPTIALLSTPYS